jgi:GNAT superfamily N-acetyltransferase
MVTMTFVFDQAQHGHLLPYIAALHASCISLDNMVGPFLPPLTNEKLLPWWKRRIAEAQALSRVIILLLPDTTLGKKPQGTDLRGIAMVKLSDDETGSFRGHIDTLLVDRRYRRQGGAKALVMALEYEASKRGRSLLVRLSVFPSPPLSLSLSLFLSLAINTTNTRHSSSTPKPTASPSSSSKALATSKSARSPTLAAAPPTSPRARPSFTRSFCRRQPEPRRPQRLCRFYFSAYVRVCFCLVSSWALVCWTFGVGRFWDRHLDGRGPRFWGFLAGLPSVFPFLFVSLLRRWRRSKTLVFQMETVVLSLAIWKSGGLFTSPALCA